MGGSKEAEPASGSTTAIIQDQDSHVVTWESPYDPENPYQWTTRKKWAITILVSMITVNVQVVTALCFLILNEMNRTFASSAPTAIITDIAEEFDVSHEVANLVTTLFLLGYITGVRLTTKRFPRLSVFF